MWKAANNINEQDYQNVRSIINYFNYFLAFSVSYEIGLSIHKNSVTYIHCCVSI